jgi:putative transposase
MQDYPSAPRLQRGGGEQQKIDYTHQNPVRRGMVANAGDYLFSSARDYAGEKSFVKIELV